MRFSFILLAGGNSSRFKSKIPKQYHKIKGKTLIDITIDKIREFKEIKKIILVYDEKHKKYFKKINLKNITLIKGGITRSKSTHNALSCLKNLKRIDKVLIHDAARPNFSKRLIRNILINAKKNKVVVPVLKIQDALKQKHNKKVVANLKRNNFFTTQTPQCFNLNEIFQLHKKNKDKYTDDDFSLITINDKVKFIKGEKKNFKITDQEDFDLYQKFHKTITKVGIGFDVHRLVKGRKLYLGGISIPSALGTLGHSDGDPVLHAIIDSILGACSMGDIGDKFSDKSIKYKNIRSDKLIKEVIDEIKKKNYVVSNIDINIITQTPKLKKFKKQISINIANLCKISLDKVNVKAKTAEKLGIIGQEKAIAAEVITSVIKNV
jgi:2-C-methyl-D-erythritol 4-phosphate cytidylyltransferase/2-C-methyl-D-erythritol 2,4-cyclodiphosphate synthase